MGRVKSILIIVLLSLIFIFSVIGLQQTTIFTESWGNTTINDFRFCSQGGATFESLNTSTMLNESFDNDWVCTQSSNSSFLNFKNSTFTQGSKNNTIISLKNSVEHQFFSGDTEIGTVFNNSVDLFGDFQFYCSDFTPSGTSDMVVSFLFGKDNSSKLALVVHNDHNNDANEADYCSVRLGSFDNCCNLEDISGIGENFCEGSTLKFYNLNDTLIQDFCNLTSTNFTDFNWFSIRSFANNGNSYDYTIDDITLFFRNGTNDLPEVNVTLDDDFICVQNNEAGLNTIDIDVIANITVDSFDAENDTILYYTSSDFSNQSLNQEFSKYETVLFGNPCSSKSITCLLKNDLNYVKRIVKRDENNCEVVGYDSYLAGLNLDNTAIRFNNSKHDLVSKNSPFDSGEKGYYLEMNNDCIGSDSTIYYSVESPLNQFSFFGSFIDLDNNESFNLSFLDVKFNPIYSLKFSHSLADEFLVYQTNSTTKLLILNQSSTILFNNNSFSFAIDSFINASTFSLINRLTTKFFFNITNDIINNGNHIQYFGFTQNDESYVLIDRFNYGGIIETKQFSDSIPNNFTLTHPGNNVFYLTFTDEPNVVLNRWETKTVQINLRLEEFCPELLAEQSNNISNDYVNHDNLKGVALFISKFIWFMQFPFRMIAQRGFVNEALAGGVFAILVYIGWHYWTYHDVKSTFITSFIASTVFLLMKFMYADLYVFIAFMFSLVFVQDIFINESDGGQLQHFVRVYTVFTLILMIAQVSGSYTLGFQNIGRPGDFSVNGILNFVLDLVKFFVNLLFWNISPTDTNFISSNLFVIINVLVWAFRLKVMLELRKYIPFFN